MKRTFDAADVERWATAYHDAVQRTVQKVTSGRIDRGNELTDLSSRHQYLGLTRIAQGDYAAALGHFAAAGTAWAYLLEQVKRGEEIDDGLIEQAPNGFVLAAASGDEKAITRMVTAYHAAGRARMSPQPVLGNVLGALCGGDLERASESLATVTRSSERADTVAMLRAIIEHDEDAFRKSVADSAERWRKAIRAERLQKFPDAVCDHWAIGDIRLAERVWGHRPNVDLAAGQIPPEIFDAVAAPVDGVL